MRLIIALGPASGLWILYYELHKIESHRSNAVNITVITMHKFFCYLYFDYWSNLITEAVSEMLHVVLRIRIY